MVLKSRAGHRYGIYHIKGTNGSGKTTLLNSILKYERAVDIDNHLTLKRMLVNVSPENIRVIDRDPVIFNCLQTFNEQILGPVISNLFDWKIFLMDKVRDLLSDELINELLYMFSQMEWDFYDRVGGGFSSGEKILISVMRALASWDKTVSILVVDECTAFLDDQVRSLFLRCLLELSASTAVYLSAHEEIHGCTQINKTDFSAQTIAIYAHGHSVL